MKLCTICARAGSKNVPNKNIRSLAGMPLIAHSIKQARATKLFDCIAVSSDGDAILNIAKEYGADLLIKRPDDLASDTAGKIPAIAHALQSAEQLSGKQFKLLVDLDATSPLRTPEDIVAAIDMLHTKNAPNVITATPARFSPYVNLLEANAKGMVALSKPGAINARATPPCFDMNASIYVWKRDAFLANPRLFYEDTALYVMPPERSMDIDDELAFAMVETLLNQRQAA